MTAEVAAFKVEMELVLVLDTGFGLGEELVLAAEVGQRAGGGFPVGVPLAVDTKFWKGPGAVLLEFTLMLGVETETEAGCTCGLLQVEMLPAALEVASGSLPVAAGVATGADSSGLWAAE